MNKIGFSQGPLYRIMDKHTKEAMDILKESGSEIIEICINSTSEIDRLKNIESLLGDYVRKSIHLPNDIRYKNDNETKDVLDKIVAFYNSIGASLILVHPDAVDDWSVFDAYPLNWAIENMDVRKQKFKFVDELKEFFKARDNWKMVLDLNHCYSNDKSMKLAEDFIDEFKNRIEEIHLSGFVDYHEPLYKTKQVEIMEFCKKLDVPIVIESVLDSIDEVQKEIDYIKNYLSN